MDTSSHAELKSTLNQLKARSKKSMFMKHIKRMYGGDKTKKNLNTTTSKDDDFIPEAEPKKLVDNDNHVDSTSNLNGNGASYSGGDNNNADVSKSSIESIGSYKGNNNEKKRRSKRVKIPNNVTDTPTPPASSSSTSSSSSSSSVTSPQLISTIDQVIEFGNNQAKHVQVEEREEVVQRENVENHQVQSNSEIVISKITKETEAEFENKKNISDEEDKDDDIEEINGDQIESIQQEPVTTTTTSSNSTIQPSDLINDDSKDETELILSQSKTFLRKSSKRNSNGTSPVVVVNSSLTTPLDSRDRSIIEPLTSKTNGKSSSNQTKKQTNYKGKRKSHVKNNKENSKPKNVVSTSQPTEDAQTETTATVETVVATTTTTTRRSKRKNADEDDDESVISIEQTEQQPQQQKRTPGRPPKNSRVVKSIRASAMKTTTISTRKTAAVPVSVTKETEIETHKIGSKRLRTGKNVQNEEENNNGDSNDTGPRRSSRMKTSRSNPKHLKPIYSYEIIKDFMGKKIYIQKITGFKQINSDLSKFREKFWQDKILNRKKQQRRNRNTNNKRKNNETANDDSIISIESNNKQKNKVVNKGKASKAKKAVTVVVEKRPRRILNRKNSNNNNNENKNDKKEISTNQIQMDNPSIEIVNDDFAPLANSSIADEEITTTTTTAAAVTPVAAPVVVNAIVKQTTNDQPITTTAISTTSTTTKTIAKITAVVASSGNNNNKMPVALVNNHDDHHDNPPVNNNNNNNTRQKSPQSTADYLSDSFEDLYNNELYEHLNEVVNIEENSQTVPRNVVRFHQLVDQKEYTELSHGVFATVIGPTEGIIRIDQLQNTITNEHDSDIHYYVQKGYITLKLNEKNILMTIGDAILIPKCNRYELLNPSKKGQAYILFKFDKL